MRINRGKGEKIDFSQVEPIEAELLKQIPAATQGEDDPKVKSRLYPDPGGSAEAGLAADWEELVRPDLEHLFLSSRRVVEEDLALIRERRGFATLSLPLAHADAWLNVLNQARLVLATRYEFTDTELLQYEPPVIFSRRDLALLQINFYAAIQERLIEALEGRLR
ncbi:MAG: DUF2017 family protein [Verrucomicrobia bacterium]|nr:DUF2017 family protein [Verrucomicrobiota bacterium]